MNTIFPINIVCKQRWAEMNTVLGRKYIEMHKKINCLCPIYKHGLDRPNYENSLYITTYGWNETLRIWDTRLAPPAIGHRLIFFLTTQGHGIQLWSHGFQPWVFFWAWCFKTTSLQHKFSPLKHKHFHMPVTKHDTEYLLPHDKLVAKSR